MLAPGSVLEGALGDLSCMQAVQFDIIDAPSGPFGFIEAEAKTRIHKTSNTEERKAMYMPYVAPVVGLGEAPWGIAWQDVLWELGLLDQGEPFGPICRTPSADGNFTKSALTSEEAGNILNNYLRIPEKSDRRTTSHSLKATTLVWAARYGIDDRLRSMLGHHALKEKRIPWRAIPGTSSPSRCESFAVCF